LFGLSSLSQFICESLPSPKNVFEAVEFLSQPLCECFLKIFNHSLTIILSHLQEIRIEQLQKLSNSVLEKILQSNELQVENEDFLFNVVTVLIERDSTRAILLNSLFFLEFLLRS
jgi:hypothetical protein